MRTILYSVDVREDLNSNRLCFKHFTLMEIKGPFPKAFKHMFNFGYMGNAIESKRRIPMLCCTAAQMYIDTLLEWYSWGYSTCFLKNKPTEGILLGNTFWQGVGDLVTKNTGKAEVHKVLLVLAFTSKAGLKPSEAPVTSGTRKTCPWWKKMRLQNI